MSNGWKVYQDSDTGRPYYYHPERGVTWDRPHEFVASTCAQTAPSVDEQHGAVDDASVNVSRNCTQVPPGGVHAHCAEEAPSADAWGHFKPTTSSSSTNPWADMTSDVTVQVPPAGVPPSSASSAWEPHVPCLLQESVNNLLHPGLRDDNGKYGGTYVDCTFGRGGHTREILRHLNDAGRLYAFDVDPDAVREARKLQEQDPRFKILHRPFGDIGECFERGQIHGVLLDLGVSSPQLDLRHRGFSVHEDGPLDLRMNPTQGVSASEWLQQITTEELAWVIHNYGEDDDAILADRIAETIMVCQHKRGGRIASTRELSTIVRGAKNHFDDHGMHPSKLTFQAIRVHLNQEMQQLSRALDGAVKNLAPSGRCCVIAFKRKESVAIRQFVREHEEPDPYTRDLINNCARLCELFPLLSTRKPYSVSQVREPIRPTRAEVERNVRSRSSTLHVLQVAKRSAPPLLECTTEVRALPARFKEPSMKPRFAGAALATMSEPDAETTDETTDVSLCESPPTAVSEPDAEARIEASSVEVRSASQVWHAHVIMDYEPQPELGEGYMRLRVGDQVLVRYRGAEGEEVGWCYGGADSRMGWFPEAHVSLA